MFEYLITRPMGFIIEHIYNLVSNYGLAIIIFTILIKLILIPLNIHSQKAMKKQQKIQPLMAELQKKYANDQEKLQREMMKIYKENNISMTGGCLPMLIQMPILIGLYQVIQKPLSYLAGVDWANASVINEVIRLKDAMVNLGYNIGNLANVTMEQLANNSQIQLSKWAGIVGTQGTALEGVSGGVHPWVLNFNFLGLDLSNAPSAAFGHIMALDFSNMSDICEVYERVTRMHVSPRQPYAGELVFTAFSGSHQDAIAKGMAWREDRQCDKWNVPYLPIDPQDVGRRYDSDVIRINSQSGKGGVNYILKQSFGISLPEKMKEEVGYLVKDVSDKAHKELTPDWVYHIFEDNYITAKTIFTVDECHFKQENGMVADAVIHHNGNDRRIVGVGNGRLDAVSNAIKHYFDVDYQLAFYEEHSLTKGSSSRAVAYVGIIYNKKKYWGVGIDADIIKASIEALVVAVNKLSEIVDGGKDERLLEITNYIYANYKNVTLEDLSEKFFLSKPYLSKYIKEKSGMTFGDILKQIRMKKARAMLRSGNATVESIAEMVGYQNVEHFNRVFKKMYHTTPVQYRNKK